VGIFFAALRLCEKKKANHKVQRGLWGYLIAYYWTFSKKCGESWILGVNKKTSMPSPHLRKLMEPIVLDDGRRGIASPKTKCLRKKAHISPPMCADMG
jgi:hypothetical protein